MKRTNDIPDISIIVAAYNCSSTISRCINSILQSSGGLNIELIVVDDGSTDDTASTIDSIRDSRIIVIHTLNNGVSTARNIGLSRACGEYVTFVDSDDYVSSDYLEILYAHAKAGYDLVISEAVDVDEAGRVVGGKTTESVEPITLGLSYDFDAPYAHSTAWGCLYARALVEGLSFAVDLSVGEDTLYFHQALSAARSPIHIAFKGYYYVHSDESIMGSKASSGYADEALAWRRVSKLFAGSEWLSRQAIALSTRHASKGVLFSSDKCGEGYRRLCTYVAKNASEAIKESLRRQKYRRAILILMAFMLIHFKHGQRDNGIVG